MNSTKETAAIIATNLTLGYERNQPVISDFSATIAQQQFVGVFGPNGAGKTTLLNCLLGLLKPLAGSLQILGQAPQRGNAYIGYVPQSMPALNVSISGEALLKATIRGERWGLPLLKPQEREQIQQMVELVGAQHYIQRPFIELSGGERQRLMLAQALLGKPRILLLDEPLANLDPHYQHLLVELLVDIKNRLGITLLLTAHDVNPLLTAMTQVLYLARGKAAIGSVKEIITSHTLSALYGSPIEVLEHQGRVFVMHATTGYTFDDHCH